MYMEKNIEIRLSRQIRMNHPPTNNKIGTGV
jgi:hypothetical protein